MESTEDGRISVSCEFCSTSYEFEPAEFVGRMPVDHWHPDDVERVRGVLASLADHPDGAVVALRTRHRTRGWLWVESSIRPVRDAAGATIEYVVTTRDTQAVEESLKALRAAAATDQNLMYPILDCARLMATEGEMVHALQDVFGTYREVPVF